jgi:hypothetical protein
MTATVKAPIIVLEGDDGLCAFRTVEDAMNHRELDGDFYDAKGRRLRRLDGSSPTLEVDSEEDRSSFIREQLEERLDRVLKATEPNGDNERALKDIEAVLKEARAEPGLSFPRLAEELAYLLRPKPRDLVFSPGTWSHYLCAAHHQ